jgi:hypothetical protein
MVPFSVTDSESSLTTPVQSISDTGQGKPVNSSSALTASPDGRVYSLVSKKYLETSTDGRTPAVATQA